MISYDFSYGDLEIFLLILVRVTSFVFVCPFFGGRQTPNLVKIGFSMLLSVMLFGTAPFSPPEYNTVMGFTVIVLKEILAGFLIGYAVQICELIASFAGTIVDMQIGLSMVNIFDPNTNEQVTITGSLYSQVLTMMLILTGMYQHILRALADTFTLIPVNSAVINSDMLLESILKFMRDYIVIGFRICLPIFIITFITNVVLGVLAKVSPQMNMFAVGIQLKMLTGLAVIFFTLGLLPTFADLIFTEAKKITVLFVEAMI